MEVLKAHGADRKRLFEKAMEGKWETVVKMYKREPWFHRAKLTGGDTALHIAVSDHQEGVVRQLVEIIGGDVLGIKNKQGNTPLHLAASIGNVSMCNCIIAVNPNLVNVRNNDMETPLFLAARHGDIKACKALLVLDISRSINVGEEYFVYRNVRGETILHCAVAGGHFQLAYLITTQFGRLATWVDEHGNSPLHLLANKPAAFSSGTHLSLIDKIIYHCIIIPESYHPLVAGDDQSSQNQTRMNFFRVLWSKIVVPTVGRNAQKAGKDKDAQNIEEGPGSTQDERDEEHNEDANPLQFPPIYDTCFNFFKLLIKSFIKLVGSFNFVSLLIKGILSILFLWLGSSYVNKIQRKKETHIWSAKVMNILLEQEQHQPYRYDRTGKDPQHEGMTMPYDTTESDTEEGNDRTGNDPQHKEMTMPCDAMESDAKSEAPADITKQDDKLSEEKDGKLERPILIAAKNGIVEMVKSILHFFPMAIHEIDSSKKNILLLAVENRHIYLYELLRKREILKDSVFGAVDKNGNSALHLSAMFKDNRPWLSPGAALLMQWEVRWFEYVKKSMSQNFFAFHNNDNKSAQQIFTESHQNLVEKGGQWLNNTATSCSVVSTLIATVAFATSTAVPGGTKEGSGKPILERQTAFRVFAISSLVALCFSVTATVMFLAILTSRYQEKNFGKDLPRKLLVGLTALFLSILAILVSFCAGHFFVLKDELKIAAFPIYAVTCLPATLFAFAQLPLYLDLIWATFSRVPQPFLEDEPML